MIISFRRHLPWRIIKTCLALGVSYMTSSWLFPFFPLAKFCIDCCISPSTANKTIDKSVKPAIKYTSCKPNHLIVKNKAPIAAMTLSTCTPKSSPKLIAKIKPRKFAIICCLAICRAAGHLGFPI